MSGHTRAPWDWVVHDHSMASLGVLPDPGLGDPLVLSVGPCKGCTERATPKEWKWGRCMTPNEADADLLSAAPTAPHECDDPECPGNVNRRKLEAFDEMLETLIRSRDTMIEWYRQDQRDVIGDEQAVKAAHREVASVREIDAIIEKATP